MKGNFFYQRIGTKISRARKGRGLTQEDLAMLACIDRTYIARIETGRANPSMMVLNKIAKVLKLKVFNLIDGV
jgi:transcriptional regulator with XRE-family HTH domain